MGLYWNPWAVTGAVAFVVGWALAGLVYWAAPRRLQNRALAVYLAFAATGFGVGVGWMFASDDVTTSLALQAVSIVGFYCATPYYLLFLSTLPTKTVKWLRPRPVRIFLAAAPLWIIPLAVANFDRIVAGVIEVPYAEFDSVWTDLGTRVFEVQALTTATWGIVAAIGAYRESTAGSPTRTQAKWYAVTFIVWETLQLTAFTILEIAFRSNEASVDLYTLAAGILFPAASLLFLLMLAYAILRAQLFGIELKVKAGLRRSLIGAPFVVVFFVANETLEGLIAVEGYVIGLVAAGAVALLFVPLQRGASRLTDRIMPGVADTAEYRASRAEELYRAAVEAAWFDGEVTHREAAMLDRLASELGLTAAARRRLDVMPP